MRIYSKGNTLVSTLLNIIGLTFAFTALYIIIVQVHYDLTYNCGIKDSERIYLLTSADGYNEGKFSPYVNRPISEGIIDGIGIIESGGLIIPSADYFGELYLTEESDPIDIKLSRATNEGVDALGYDLIEGSWTDWVKNGLAMSESYASRYGIKIGDHVRLAGYDWVIAVIYRDFPENSDFTLHDALYNIGDQDFESWGQWSYNYFVKFQPGVSDEEINSALDIHLRNWFKDEEGKSNESIDEKIKRYGLRFFALNDIYLNPIVNSVGNKGNKTTTMTLLGVAILIIIIAFINYFNFFFALVPVKLKEINIRKMLGSRRKSLIISIVKESLFYVMVALGFGAILVVIFAHSPYANLINTSVLFKYHWGLTFITIGAALAIGIISSIFPASYITSFNPALAIRGFIGSSSRGNAFRTGLIGFQFTISLILVVCAIVINQQRRYMLNYDLGFNKENLYSVRVSPNVASKADAVESRLLQDTAITDVTWAAGPMVAEGRMGWGRNFNGEQISLQVYPVAWNFLKFMDIAIDEGRDFGKSDNENENGLFIMNKEAREKYDFKIGDRFTGHRDDENPAEVIGFSDDFKYKPLRDIGGAFCFYLYGKYPWGELQQMYVRTSPSANPEEVRNKIIQILKEMDPEINENQYQIDSFDETLEYVYYKEKNLSMLINLFTLLAIVISLMGVFGLVMFDTERRKKEIGIRRVNGATVEEILGMFNMKFIKIIIVSFIIAVPISLWIMRTYLEAYAYKTPIYIWVFFVALLAVLLITTGVVTLRSYKAATANPVESLRTE
ncbi:MAG: ABC transporter permease [Muribaculaceae bacterium]|nr:ABC transporter permease [Muribaculaceae bacterium]